MDVTNGPFGPLCDPIRRAILELLARRSRSVTELGARFPVSRPAISRHLRVLRAAGWVREERRGRERHYHLRAGRLEAARRWLDALAEEAAAATEERPGTLPRWPTESAPRARRRPPRTLPEAPPAPRREDWRAW